MVRFFGLIDHSTIASSRSVLCNIILTGCCFADVVTSWFIVILAHLLQYYMEMVCYVSSRMWDLAYCHWARADIRCRVVCRTSRLSLHGIWPSQQWITISQRRWQVFAGHLLRWTVSHRRGAVTQGPQVSHANMWRIWAAVEWDGCREGACHQPRVWYVVGQS